MIQTTRIKDYIEEGNLSAKGIQNHSDNHQEFENLLENEKLNLIKYMKTHGLMP